MLTKDQIADVESRVKHELKRDKLDAELLDSTCCEVEAKMSNGIAFNDALNQVFTKSNKRSIIDAQQRIDLGYRLDIFRNYCLVAWRNIRRNKAYSLINISGLSIGIASALLIGMYVFQELSFDRFHKKHNNIYRLANAGIVQGDNFESALTPFPWGAAMREDFPEVSNVVRFKTPNSRFMVQYGEEKYYESGFFFADSTVFEVFSFELIAGDPSKVLDEPNSVVITEAMAQKYFKGENPMGKIIEADLSMNLMVTGIMREVPVNSHMDFDFLVSIGTLRDYRDAAGNRVYGNMLTNWLPGTIYTYLEVHDEVDIQFLESRIPEFLERHVGDRLAQAELSFEPFLQPLTDIHLRSDIDSELGQNNQIYFLYIFSAIGVFILLIAAFNFMNLSTARAVRRSKEVGIRKAIGAHKKQLIGQFLSESLITAIISALVGLLIVTAAIPKFNLMLNTQLSLREVDALLVGGLLITLILIVGLISGSYPALYLSRFDPIKVLKARLSLRHSGGVLRRVLVVLQFSISAMLLVGIMVVYSQMKYMQQMDLGYSKDFIVAVPQVNPDAISRFNVFKEALLRDPAVKKVSASNNIPGESFRSTYVRLADNPDQENISIHFATVEFDFLELLEMDFLEGRNFDRNIKTDSASAVIINKSAAEALGIEEAPTEHALSFTVGSRNQVIGVVDDFHFKSLHDPVAPFVFVVNGYFYMWSLIKVETDDLTQSIESIQSAWEEVNSDLPFDFVFLDEKYDQLYRSEESLGNLLNIFSVLAIVIASMGLYGLISYVVEQRKPEIGIRKVMGASIVQLSTLVLKSFIGLVIMANLIAAPISYWVMNDWLNRFAYRGSIGVDAFMFSALLTISLCVMVVSSKAIRAAKANPVQVLKED